MNIRGSGFEVIYKGVNSLLVSLLIVKIDFPRLKSFFYCVCKAFCCNLQSQPDVKPKTQGSRNGSKVSG